MRRSWKRFVPYFIASVVLINFDIFSRVDLSIKDEIDGATRQAQNRYADALQPLVERRLKTKADNDFLVLDWTGEQHVFQVPDPIPCKSARLRRSSWYQRITHVVWFLLGSFPHITQEDCQSRFVSITNTTLQLYLVKRCSQLPSLVVHWTTDRNRLTQADLVAFHSMHLPTDQPPPLERGNRQQQYSAVFTLESEAYSRSNPSWKTIDFPMWYNFVHSYPEPAAYFDNRIYLNQLFAPVRVPFASKTQQTSTVWITSNWWVTPEVSSLRRIFRYLSSNAYNGRHVFVQHLMSYMGIDSLGDCMNNIPGNSGRGSDRRSNALIYASYKFVVAIENSNCEDYVTEEFIHAISSTAVPIVTSRDNKPDYLRFAPRHSYINIYDYKSVEELANHLKYLSLNETAYNEYLWYRPRSNTVIYPLVRHFRSDDIFSHLESSRSAGRTIARWESSLGKRNAR